MLRQIKWRLQNGPITKSGILPVTTLLFWKICFVSILNMLRYYAIAKMHAYGFRLWRSL